VYSKILNTYCNTLKSSTSFALGESRSNRTESQRTFTVQLYRPSIWVAWNLYSWVSDLKSNSTTLYFWILLIHTVYSELHNAASAMLINSKRKELTW